MTDGDRVGSTAVAQARTLGATGLRGHVSAAFTLQLALSLGPCAIKTTLPDRVCHCISPHESKRTQPQVALGDRGERLGRAGRKWAGLGRFCCVISNESFSISELRFPGLQNGVSNTLRVTVSMV